MLHANPAQVIFQSRSLLGRGGSAPYIQEKHTHTQHPQTHRETLHQSPITHQGPWREPLGDFGGTEPVHTSVGLEETNQHAVRVWCWHHAVRVWSRQWCVYYSKYINVSYPPSTQKIYHLLVFSVFLFFFFFWLTKFTDYTQGGGVVKVLSLSYLVRSEVWSCESKVLRVFTYIYIVWC